jgi:hypothetical protein
MVSISSSMSLTLNLNLVSYETPVLWLVSVIKVRSFFIYFVIPRVVLIFREFWASNDFLPPLVRIVLYLLKFDCPSDSVLVLPVMKYSVSGSSSDCCCYMSYY